MKNSPPGMSPSYEMYRNLETYPVGCFIIYFYVSASRIFRIWMRWKYHSALIAINPNIRYNTADIYSSAYQMSFLHTIRRCKVKYDHTSLGYSYSPYMVSFRQLLNGQRLFLQFQFLIANKPLTCS